MSEQPTFDTALTRVVSVTADMLGDASVESGRVVFLRDATGVITVVLTDSELAVKAGALLARLKKAAPYTDDGSVIVAGTEFAAANAEHSTLVELVDVPSRRRFSVRLIDRRIIGADWQRFPSPAISDLPTFVFWSLKGGVGRSTALAVAASSFAREGLNVLVVDLDLEAPGIGAALLAPTEEPRFGTLDYYVESELRDLGPDFYRNLLSPCRLTDGRGLVMVSPALGRLGNDSPENFIPKLGRAYLGGHDGKSSFLDQTRLLITKLIQQDDFDVLLIDARAGLNESTAASLLGIGGTVLMFGVDSPQTFQGYRYLMSHLNRFARTSDNSAWRSNFQMVHAKASTSPERIASFRDNSFDLFSRWLYDEADYDDQNAFNFDLDDEYAPHYAWPIYHDSNFLEFDPVAKPHQLSSELTERTYGRFISALKQQMGIAYPRDADEPA